MKVKKTKKNQNEIQKKYLSKDLIGLIIIAIGIISMISLITDKVGLIGSIIKGTIFSMMGFGGYFIPFILIGLGILTVLDKFDKNKNKQIVIIACLFLMFLIALDSKNITTDSFINRIKISIYLSNFNKGGGVIGSFMGYFFYKLFGLVGGYIVLFFGTTIGLLLLFDIKLNDLYQITFVKINNIIPGKKEHKKLKKVEKEHTQKDYREKTNSPQNNEIEILDYNESVKKTSIENFSNHIESKPTREFEKKDDIIYYIPPLELLKSPNKQEIQDKEYILKNAKLIEETMENFGISSKITQINKGPTITCYELLPSPGIKLSKIASLADNIALSLASSDIRIEAPIPGKSAVGIEVPNKIKDNVTLKEVLLSEKYIEMESDVPIALGKDVTGKPVVSSIDKMPHLLIAGATGSGKSVCINTIIMSILYKSSPNDVKLLLIDPKVVELSVYNKIPHLLIPVVTEPKKATSALNWAVGEMENRYKTFAENNVRDIHSYNEKCNLKGTEKMSMMVIIVDELSDLMMVAAQEIEEYICRLAQMARAAGIYLIIATQRPSVDVITGTIKANIPSRISFAVSSQIDSRTILDMSGAEKLLGKGDMLFYPSFFSKPLRIQGAFISDNEVETVVDFLNKGHKLSYNKDIMEAMENSKTTGTFEGDELFVEAVELIIAEGQASISMLQRRFKIGYARAARIIDVMEEQGIIGGYEGSKPRKVLITKEDLDKINI